MTLDEIFKLDLGYHPAVNNPINIIQTACNALMNKHDGLCRTITAYDFDKNPSVFKIIDLRPFQEYEAGSISNSISNPLKNIRMEDIPFDYQQKILLYSSTSSRAYEAFHYFESQGYSALYVLEGGYLFWKQ